MYDSVQGVKKVYPHHDLLVHECRSRIETLDPELELDVDAEYWTWTRIKNWKSVDADLRLNVDPESELNVDQEWKLNVDPELTGSPDIELKLVSQNWNWL